MEVITTHTNADFDTLASMVAAKKLYPNGHLVFPGSLEKGLRDAMETLELPFPIERVKDIDLERITRLILVDIRQASRIGPFSKIIGRKDLDIHIYDHHPQEKRAISGSVDVYEEYGSTTTILTLLLKKKGIKLTPQEATILMTGIYEDTGMLTYPATTQKDYEAASYLLSNGADLKKVSDLLKKEMTPDEVSALNALLQDETTYTVGGIDIVIATVSVDKYKGDVAMLAHRLRDIEGMRCLFVLATLGDRVHVVARSAIPEVHAGNVAKILGGGGHPQAASATLKNMTIIQARERVLAALKQTVLPKRTAIDIMTAPTISTLPETPIKEAQKVLRRYDINAIPVVKDGAVQGVITRQTMSKAVYHGLGKIPVKDYMSTEVECVSTTTSIDEIREKTVVHGQRLLPVLKDGLIAGVITRTDLLKLLQEELSERPAERQKKRSLKSLMNESLPEWAIKILKDVGATAGALGFNSYVVGGFVRDLLLRRENLDIDIVIEGGDGIAFAREFAKRYSLKVKGHERFRTAVVVFPDGFKIDVATARLEYYERPGALPTVELSSLKLDLYRRDFTINTLAMALNPGRFGELIDFFSGQRDIKDKTIKVLHNLSFVEDPTRTLRAVRFSERFGFGIGKQTMNLIKNAVKLDLLSRLSGVRLRDELENVLMEDTAAGVVQRLSSLGLLGLIHSGIKWDEEEKLLFERTKETLAWHRLLYTKDKVEEWLVLFLAFTDRLTDAELKGLVKRLAILGKKRQAVISSRSEGIKAINLLGSGRVRTNSELYGLLHPLPLEVTIYLMARSKKEAVTKAISTYITKLRGTKTVLKGDDLKKLGIGEGPQIGELLARLFCKRLDGEVETREDEERFVRGVLAESKIDV
jgi:tRNA nucleotidyltransferase (CCA-adding enzyme)